MNFPHKHVFKDNNTTQIGTTTIHCKTTCRVNEMSQDIVNKAIIPDIKTLPVSKAMKADLLKKATDLVEAISKL